MIFVDGVGEKGKRLSNIFVKCYVTFSADLFLMSVPIRLLDEAADGLHLLSDKLPPPGMVDGATTANFLALTFLLNKYSERQKKTNICIS